MKIFAILMILLLHTGGSDQDAAAQSISPEKIEGIYMRTVTRYGLSGVYVTNAIYLMLKDGDIYKNLTVSPDALDVAASKREEGKHWGHWRREGDEIRVVWSNDKSEQWTKWFVTETASKGERIAGAFKSSDPFTGAKVFNMNTVVLTEEGTYYWFNQKGGETSWHSVIAEREASGRYELNGHTITFYDKAGSEASFLFYFYPGKRDYFGIGKHHFVPVKEKD